jgi:single-strand DNA-binding protein
MANEPVVTVTGNLVKDPELKFTANGKPVASFTIANTPRFPDQATGQWKDHETWFVPCTAWDAIAENCCETLQKGMAVLATGRLRARSWEDPNGGGKRSRVEMTVDAIGPDLRRSMARVTKVTRDRPADNGTDPIPAAGVPARPAPAAAPAAMNPWEMPPPGPAAGYPDEPPF